MLRKWYVASFDCLGSQLIYTTERNASHKRADFDCNGCYLLCCGWILLSLSSLPHHVCIYLYCVPLSSCGSSTNQTTLEHISPFLLLRELPPIPPPASGRRLSSPPEEDELNWAQRSLVKSAHGYLRLYDVGWKRNWAAVYGWDSESRPWGWVWRLLIGGGWWVHTFLE